jgi:hypothetical protein
MTDVRKLADNLMEPIDRATQRPMSVRDALALLEELLDGIAARIDGLRSDLGEDE